MPKSIAVAISDVIFYKYLLNIKTMLEGWERFWLAADLGW